MKAKKCKICSEVYIPRSFTQLVCSVKCAIEYQKTKFKTKYKKDLHQDICRIQDLKNEAKRIFQKWTRQRDINDPCISCQKLEAKQWDGGHYYKAEIWSNLIFHEDNVHKQCSYCNRYLHGNLILYDANLKVKIGQEKYNALQDLAKNKSYKWSREELCEIIKKYKK